MRRWPESSRKVEATTGGLELLARRRITNARLQLGANVPALLRRASDHGDGPGRRPGRRLSRTLPHKVPENRRSMPLARSSHWSPPSPRGEPGPFPQAELPNLTTLFFILTPLIPTGRLLSRRCMCVSTAPLLPLPSCPEGRVTFALPRSGLGVAGPRGPVAAARGSSSRLMVAASPGVAVPAMQRSDDDGHGIAWGGRP